MSVLVKATASQPLPLPQRPWALRKLPPFPPVATKLMYLVAQEDVPLNQVADLIRADAAFSAEVLRLANSPLFGARAQVSTISHALCMIGFGRLYSLVITSALSNFLARTAQNPLLGRCWRHSLACALASQELAAEAGLNKDYLYTAGLLHDIGRLALVAAYPAEYARMLEVAGDQLGLLQFERDLFEVDHCQAGQWLMDQWMLPPEFREITGNHHTEPEGTTVSAALVVHLSCLIADMLGFHVAGAEPPWDLDRVRAKLPLALGAELDEECLKAIPAKIRLLEFEITQS